MYVINHVSTESLTTELMVSSVKNYQPAVVWIPGYKNEDKTF